MQDGNLKGLVLMPTYRCNLSCDYCYNPAPRDARTLLDEIAVKTVIRAARDLGAISLDLVGGEPTILPSSYLQMILRASSGMKRGVSSNGMLPMRNADLVSILKEFDFVQLSIHPFRFTNHELIAHFSKIAELARKLEKPPNSIIINMVIDARTTHLLRNHATFEEIGSALQDLIGTLELNVANLVGHAVVNTSIIPSVREIIGLKSELADLESVLHVHNIRLVSNVGSYFLPRPNTWGRNAVILSPSGHVLPMDESTIELLHRGAVQFNTWKQPLEETWSRSESFNLFRGEDWLPEVCRRCPLLKWCEGGNRTDALIVGGDLFGVNPFCLCSPTHESVLGSYGGNHPGDEDLLRDYYFEFVKSIKLSPKTSKRGQ